MAVAVVIVAGGSGRRLGDEGPPKQFRPILGVPMLEWSLSTFLDHPAVGSVAVVLPERYANDPPDWICSYEVTVVAGGDRRSDSVRAGIDALGTDVERVMIHDGARPFPGADLIDRLLAAGAGAVIPGIGVSDTIKEVGSDRTVVTTLDRERLRAVQTPQLFPLAVLRDAHERAAAADLSTSDDAGLLEWLGYPVAVVPGDPQNIKVTTAIDLELAEVLARRLPLPRRVARAPRSADPRDMERHVG